MLAVPDRGCRCIFHILSSQGYKTHLALQNLQGNGHLCEVSLFLVSSAMFSSYMRVFLPGLRTPTRDSAAEEDGDLNKMQEDLERVRQEMRDEATSASRPSLATPDCPSPCKPRV